MRSAGLALLCFFAAAGCASADAPGDEPSTSDELRGGVAESGWRSSGYLVAGASERSLGTKVVCGATLVAQNVVITAAHCIAKADPTNTAFAFGTGEVGSGATYAVDMNEVHYHPGYHADPQGSFDVGAYLRKDDLAYLVLKTAVPRTEAIAARVADVESGAKVRAIGYGPQRRSANASIILRPSWPDPLLEVHPTGGAALCLKDGDDGSALVLHGAESGGSEGERGGDVLVGIFVGSVTGPLTDCRPYVQFLNGYESLSGHRAFLDEAIARGTR